MILTDAAREWTEAAERDRDAARALLISVRVPFEIVAFHCQQCAEKYLKSVYIQNGRKVPFIHDLQKLSHDIRDICPSMQDIEIECERLTPFGTVTRYPGSAMQPSAEHMPLVQSWMEAIRSAVCECLERLPPKQ